MDAAKQIPSSSVHERSFKGERSTRHELLRVSYFVSPERLNVMRRNRRQKEVSRVEGCDAKTSRGQTTTNPKASSESTFRFRGPEPRTFNHSNPTRPSHKCCCDAGTFLVAAVKSFLRFSFGTLHGDPLPPRRLRISTVSLSNWGSL